MTLVNRRSDKENGSMKNQRVERRQRDDWPAAEVRGRELGMEMMPICQEKRSLKYEKLSSCFDMFLFTPHSCFFNSRDLMLFVFYTVWKMNNTCVTQYGDKRGSLITSSSHATYFFHLFKSQFPNIVAGNPQV